LVKRHKRFLYGGKLKADTNKTFVSKGYNQIYCTGGLQCYRHSLKTKKGEVNKLDESMPDSSQ
jgi:hypothetical protein